MWRTNDRYPYAIKSFLEDIYPDWLTLNKLESTLVLARLSRAYPRLIHYIDVTNQDGETRKSTFNSYVKNFTNASKNNTNGDFLPVEKDIYLTRSYLNAEDGSSEQDLTKIDFYDPSNTGLAQIGDIEYIRRKIFNRAPGAIVGIAGNRDISQQDIAYANLVKQVQRIGKAILKQIFDVQLVLTGQVDSDGNIAPYEIVLPSVHMQTYWKYADAQYRSSLKDIAYVEAGVVSRQSVYMDAFNATSDDWQEELSKIQNENAIFTPEKPTGTFGASSAANMTIAGQKGGVAKPADTTNASVASQQNAPNQQTK